MGDRTLFQLPKERAIAVMIARTYGRCDDQSRQKSLNGAALSSL